MNTDSWQGVFPAVTTKFKADMSLDLDAMAKHLEFQLEAGVHGVIILGSLGENIFIEINMSLRSMLVITQRTKRCITTNIENT